MHSRIPVRLLSTLETWQGPCLALLEFLGAVMESIAISAHPPHRIDRPLRIRIDHPLRVDVNYTGAHVSELTRDHTLVTQCVMERRDG